MKLTWRLFNFFLYVTFIEMCFCQDDVLNSGNNVSDIFNWYLQKYNKNYANNTEEYLRKLAIFKESVERIERINSQIASDQNSAKYGVTQYSDMTPEEFLNHVVKKASRKKHNETFIERRVKFSYDHIKNIPDVPKRVDWREKNVVTSVKSQEKCGACWAFSTIETVESMNALKTGKLTELSVEQIIDCAHEGNQGCDGGDTCSALEWMAKENVYIQTESEYPYREGTSTCKVPKPTSGVRVSPNYTCVNYINDEEGMVRALASHGPLVAAVDATTWQDYLGGIIQFHCEHNRNHAVQIVGYDLTGDIPYYIVRNTWGTSFGIDGYLHIAIGKNLCAIAEEVSEVDVL